MILAKLKLESYELVSSDNPDETTGYGTTLGRMHWYLEERR